MNINAKIISPPIIGTVAAESSSLFSVFMPRIMVVYFGD